MNPYFSRHRTLPGAAVLGALALLVALPARADGLFATAAKAGNFKTLLKLEKAAKVNQSALGKTKLTIFAPTDAAFAKLPRGTVEMLMKPANQVTLQKILTYHVLAGVIPAKKVLAMPSPSKVKTSEGESLIIKHKGSTVMVNAAKVTKADIMADNGVIHAIDTVLIPPSVVKALSAKKVTPVKGMSSGDQLKMRPKSSGPVPIG